MPPRSPSAPTRLRSRFEQIAAQRGAADRDRPHRLARAVLAGAAGRGGDAAGPRRLRPGERRGRRRPCSRPWPSNGAASRCGSASPTRSPGSSARPASPSPAAASSIRARSTTIAPMAATRAWSARCRSARTRSVKEVTASGLRGRGGAGFPTGIKWKTVAASQGRPQIHRLQRRRRRQRHLRRPHDHGRRSLPAHRGHDDRRHRRRRHQGLHLHPLANIRTRSRR